MTEEITGGPMMGKTFVRIYEQYHEATNSHYGVYRVDGIGYVFAWGDRDVRCVAKGLETPADDACAEYGHKVYETRVEALGSLRDAWECVCDVTA